MNPLQEHPHLFANGIFNVKIHYGKNRKLIEGFTWKQLCTVLAYTKHCTLIARTISDMTDEEVISYNDNWEGNIDRAKEVFASLCNTGRLPLALALHLSDRGVYFGSQSNFDDGTVIDATTL